MSITHRLFEGVTRPGTEETAVLAGCWGVLGLVVFGSWVACIVPPRAAFVILSRSPETIPKGTAAGAAAFVAGLIANRFYRVSLALTLWLVEHLLRIFSEDVVSLPTERVIGTTAFNVEIAPACLGYHGDWPDGRARRRFLLISRGSLKVSSGPLASAARVAILSYLANVVRITVLILLGTHVFQDLRAREHSIPVSGQSSFWRWGLL